MQQALDGDNKRLAFFAIKLRNVDVGFSESLLEKKAPDASGRKNKIFVKRSLKEGKFIECLKSGKWQGV